nr:10089_t:CDS:1 [Entrophospora candida]
MSPLSKTFGSQTLVDTTSQTTKNATSSSQIFTKETVPSILEIKKQIPSQCFSPSILKSLQYVILDLSIIAVLFFLYFFIDKTTLIPEIVKDLLILPIYSFAQGTMFWAIFVLGHDCGHGSFSRYPLFNDIIGTFLHLLILVPYTPWKLSHRHHHKNTGNIDKDEVFFPVRKSDTKHTLSGKEETIVTPYFAFGIGWAVYLIIGYGPRAICHLNPLDPFFKNHRTGASISVIGIFSFSALLYYLSTLYGPWNIIKYYFLPLLIFGSWLVITTFLHHHGVENNLKLPWYADEQWSYVLGNLSSVDRDYGLLHNVVHTIGTHQVHHLFPSIPHYYLTNATEAFQNRYPQLIRESKEPILKTFINMYHVWRSQYLIADDTKVFVYQEINDKINDSKKQN